MKQVLLGLTVALATATTAVAQNVTVFGVTDIGYRSATWTDAGANRAKATGVADGALSGNRLGFRGTEDLGSGLKASFHIEQGISLVSADLTNQRQSSSSLPVSVGGADSGRTAATNRQSWVGLSGGFGEIRAGYQYTNLYEVSTLSGFNVGSESLHGADTAHTMGGIGGSRANGITYYTPVIKGLQLVVQHGGSGHSGFAGANDQYSYATTGGAGYKSDRLSARVKYQAGPVHVQLAQTQVEEQTSAAGSFAYGAATKRELTQLGGSWNLGFATVAGTYGEGKPVKGTSTNKGWQVGASVPVGSISVVAATGAYELNTGAAKTTDVTTQQIGARYALSKRTTAYAYTGVTKDKGTGSAVDKKDSYMIGVMHSF